MASFIRYVHRPYRKPDIYTDATPRKSFDHTRMYRVFVVEPDTGTLIDVEIPGCVGDRGHLQSHDLIRTFYVGAEADLDRYLRWLTNVGLLDDHGVPRDVCVVEQMTEHFQEELDQLNGKYNYVIIYPGQLTYYGVLLDNSDSADSWALY